MLRVSVRKSICYMKKCPLLPTVLKRYKCWSTHIIWPDENVLNGGFSSLSNVTENLLLLKHFRNFQFCADKSNKSFEFPFICFETISLKHGIVCATSNSWICPNVSCEFKNFITKIFFLTDKPTKYANFPFGPTQMEDLFPLKNSPSVVLTWIFALKKSKSCNRNRPVP